jgi:hypothetical protein
MRYQPQVHTGTEEQRVLGLLEEYVGIESDGMLRIHAKDRECNRIAGELNSMGYTLWGDFDSLGQLTGEEEWLIARKSGAPHEPGCPWSETHNDCRCANPLRVRVPFYRGAEQEEEADEPPRGDVGCVLVNPSRRNGDES